MILILNSKATPEQIAEVTKFYENYTKVVVDTKKEILAAGSEYHIDCEKALLDNGSKQGDLWGGGYRFNTNEIDFMALTNYKPDQNHFTYEISFPEVRNKVSKIIMDIFGNE